MSCIGVSLAQVNGDSTLVQDSIITKKDSTRSGTDTTVVIDKKVKEKHFEYFRVGLDVSKLVRSALTDRYNTVELLAEGVWKPKMHYVFETGWANGLTVNTTPINERLLDTNVMFKSSSTFIRLGFDKYFFGTMYDGDLDNAFIGLRLAGAYHKRQEATATLWDPFYGNTTITQPAASQLLYWIELTAGFRLELSKNIFVGWNVRGKTFINPNKIKELTPHYLAGYGQAKKQPAIDYNLYLSYGFGKR